MAEPTFAGLVRMVPPPGAAISGVTRRSQCHIPQDIPFGLWFVPSVDNREAEPPFCVIFRIN